MIKIRLYIVGVLLLLSYQRMHAAAFWKKKPKTDFNAAAFVHSACDGPHALEHCLTKKYIACAFVCASDGKSTQEELQQQAEETLVKVSKYEKPEIFGFAGGDLLPRTDIPEKYRKVRYIAAFKVTKRYMIADLGCSTVDTRSNDANCCALFNLRYKIVRKRKGPPTIFDFAIFCDETKAMSFSLGDTLEVSERIMRSPIDVSEVSEQNMFKNARKPVILLNLAKLMSTHFR